jgi:ATP diphosphatase
VKALWGQIKAEEKRRRAEARGERAGLGAEAPHGALSGFPRSMPALTRALKLQEKAAKVGFDWDDVAGVVAKLREEIAETEAEIASGSRDRLAAEMGDLLFAAVNLARFVEIDPEAALRGANAKFERRFAHIEQRLAERGQRPAAASLDDMEALWQEAKDFERQDR